MIDVATLVGRTITAASTESANDGPCTLVLSLDDDRTIDITAWGHDNWGLDITDTT